MPTRPSDTSTRPVPVPVDAVRLAGLVAVGAAALWFDGVAVALMLLGLGGLMVPRALGTQARLDAAYGVGLLVAAWSAVLHAYDALRWWDVVVHLVVTGLVAAVGYDGIVRLRAERAPAEPAPAARAAAAGSPGDRVSVALVTALGLGLGLLWELAEWLGHTYLDRSIHVTPVDTLGDLLAGAAGSAVAGALLVRRDGWARRAGRH